MKCSDYATHERCSLLVTCSHCHVVALHSQIVGNYDRSVGGGRNMASKLAQVGH